MKIGYARVSTRDQKLDLQLDALTQAGCEEVFQETASGKNRERPELEKLLAFARKGDTIVVYKLDRMGRSIRDLINIVGQLDEKGVHLKVLSPDMDTSTPAGRMVFNIFAALAEFERELIVERTQAGLASAKERGVKLGRSRSLTTSEADKAAEFYWELGGDGSAVEATMKKFDISRSTFYRIVKPKIKELQRRAIHNAQ